MLKAHEKFHSEKGKRLILVADDEQINRELLGAILEREYELIFAENGSEALERIQEHRETLSLVLLDLMMPVMSGTELLQELKKDDELSRIPVIVLTADQDAEVASLDMGANDFIQKPYPDPNIILARINRTIELSEDRQTISATERDPLTGLYNREFFYTYANQFDHHHHDLDMDAIVIDINHFHMLNERFGKEYGDEVLRRIGGRVREMVGESGGIVCRREADTFLVYCPHREDYETIFMNASAGLTEDDADASSTRVRMRMGVYSIVDKTVDIERRFDRAKLAADTIRNNYTKTIAIYDSMLHESELYAEQLTEDFFRAVRERQFKVFYQPKFDIRGEEPILSSAEALVRWKHPELGMISPGVFIPLFEQNGMIRRLDQYVWQEAARQIADWKARFGFSVPVSVNVSRVDMYDTGLVDNLSAIVEEFSLEKGDFLLEITESAYTEDSEFIISTVRALRDRGFRIEMDDFGTGYSSLAMISRLPIDALKMDMLFVRNAFGEKRDMRVLELIMGIAEHLGVPVVAEGVETKEQLTALRNLGCDLVQGYYFSRPVPAEEFDRFMAERQNMENSLDSIWNARTREQSMTFARVAQALAGDYLSIYYVNLQTDSFVEFSASDAYAELGIEKKGDDFFALSRENILRVMAEEDQPDFLRVFTKENLVSELEKNGAFTTSYRLLLADGPTYVRMKAIRMGGGNEKFIVVGVSSIQSEMIRRRELDEARTLANRDPLTGVKSRYAFEQAQNCWNGEIRSGEAEPFAAVLCDLNGLKTMNDTQGHKAGDRLIFDASQIICENFKHSPVFRIGGDEFFVLLRGQDYEHRDALLRRITALVQENAQTGGVVISCGMADYRPGEDDSFDAVFNRADAAMYEDKKRLKE